MSSHDLTRDFASQILPKDIEAETLALFQAIARPVSVGRGERIRLDEQHAQFVFLGKGATKLVAHASSGREQIVAFHFQNDLISVPPRGPHAYNLSGLLECDMLVFPADKFMQVAGSRAEILAELCNRSMTALWRCREKAVQLGRKTASERIAGFLLVMAERAGSKQGCACGLHLPMSRRDIADSLGLTIETVSRQLRDLKTLGLIETSGRSCVNLRDIDALRARADLLPAKF